MRLIISAFAAGLFLVSGTGVALAQRGHVLRSTAGRDSGTVSIWSHVPHAEEETFVTVQGRLLDAAHASHAAAWLIVTAKYYAAPTAEPASGAVTLRIPLSSTEDAYGESRSCKQRGDGPPVMTFEAGLDEQNFISFAESKDDHSFRFLLNKYLCRALATSFHCGGRDVTLPHDMALWRFTDAAVSLHSDGPASMHVTGLDRLSTATPFDYARCAAVAPSNGLCCVQHHTTEWHCGGKPAGEGWHQVSGDCYHRETGGSCGD